MIAVATPGPAMVALIARSLARGAGPGLRMALGIALADVILGTLALLGLTALLAKASWSLAILKYAGAAYLTWLGWRMWHSPPAPPGGTAPVQDGNVAAGLAVGLGNPKAMLFHASLMPLIVDLRQLDWPSGLAIVAIIFGANLAVMSVYALAASAGGRRLRSPARIQWMSRLAGGTMVGAGIAIAAR